MRADNFPHYIRSGQTLLRCGYTTGTCAALAAAGAARLLLTGTAPALVSLTTPKGIKVTVPLTSAQLSGDKKTALCAVTKDGGDDHDITDGMLICAALQKTNTPGIAIDGGAGVGRITKPGLDQPVGAAAINHVPRQMIEEQVRGVCQELDYKGGMTVIISIPGGAEAAAKTFNPMLGIEGGLSVLGTSGIVEPMSEQALVDTIALQERQAAAAGYRRVILTPGNYGADFLRDAGLEANHIPVIKCSNFLGDALDIAAGHFQQVLLVAHIGKLVKVAGGIMNTHSRYADCRTELFCAHAAVCGAAPALCRALMDAPTTDACIELLDCASLREPVLKSLLAAVQHHLTRRAAGAYEIGAVTFSNVYGVLGATPKAQEILKTWKQKS